MNMCMTNTVVTTTTMAQTIMYTTSIVATTMRTALMATRSSTTRLMARLGMCTALTAAIMAITMRMMTMSRALFLKLSASSTRPSSKTSSVRFCKSMAPKYCAIKAC